MFGIDDALLGGGISGLGSMLGGLFGSQNFQSSGDQLRSLMNAAGAAGINPLAVIGSNLGSSWGGMNPIGDAVGTGIAKVGQAIASRDPNAGLNTELLKAKIATEHAQAADLISSATSRSALAKARAASTGGPVAPALSLQGPTGDVFKWKTGPSSNSSDVAKNYGWMVEGPYGVYRAVTDGVSNLEDYLKSVGLW